MKKWIIPANASGLLGSFGFSVFSFLQGWEDWVTFLSGLAGAFLTVMLGLVHLSNFKKNMAEARIARAEASRKEIENALLQHRNQKEMEKDLPGKDAAMDE